MPQDCIVTLLKSGVTFAVYSWLGSVESLVLLDASLEAFLKSDVALKEKVFALDASSPAIRLFCPCLERDRM